MGLIRRRPVGSLLRWLFILFLSSSLFAACSREGSGGGEAPQETSEQENMWEKMVWDQGRWG